MCSSSCHDDNAEHALGDLSVAEQMPVSDDRLPVRCCAWRDYSVNMPISHTSATVCCIHDEDVRREVQLEMRRWLKGTLSEPGPANQSHRNDSVDSPGPSAEPHILRLASSDCYTVECLFCIPCRMR
jgi:hypothetical protein